METLFINLVINFGLVSLGFLTGQVIFLVLKGRKRRLPISKYEGHERVEIPVTYRNVGKLK